MQKCDYAEWLSVLSEFPRWPRKIDVRGDYQPLNTELCSLELFFTVLNRGSPRPVIDLVEAVAGASTQLLSCQVYATAKAPSGSFEPTCGAENADAFAH